MYITTPEGLAATRFKPGKKGPFPTERLPKGRIAMCIAPDPNGAMADPWVVLRNDQTIGLPLSQLRGIADAQIDGVWYSVIGDEGFDLLLYSEARRGKSDSRTPIRGRVQFYHAQNPSGRPLDQLWFVQADALDAGKSVQAISVSKSVLQLHPVFPPFLNAVAKDGKTRSRGTAVWLAQRLLAAAVRAMPPANWPRAFSFNGVYDDPFRECVRAFQRFFGFEGEDLDGNLGPKTREMASHKLGIDFDDIMNDEFGAMTHTVWVDAEGDVHEWPIEI